MGHRVSFQGTRYLGFERGLEEPGILQHKDGRIRLWMRTDIGHQYRTGIYFDDPTDEESIRASLLGLEKEVGQPLAVECCPLLQYYTAEEWDRYS